MSLMFGIYVILCIHPRKNWNLQYLQPKPVISTTPRFRAMELDHVRNNCSIGSVASDDLLWKLLDIRTEGLQITQACATEAEANDLQPPSMDPAIMKQNGSLSSPAKAGSLTLFGRAWLGLHDSLTLPEPHKASTAQKITDVAEQLSKVGEDGSTDTCKEKYNGGSGTSKEAQSLALNSGLEEDASCVGPSRSLDLNLRKLYRSMNVPVPRPLPSLVELIDVAKRAKACAGKR